MTRNLEALAARRYDVAVVGGGIYGICIARQAALHGLSVALLERDDFAAATSANSLKIMHGGLRYLQNMDFRRMRESIRERRRIGALAPHLVKPMPFLIPCFGHGLRGREVMGVALAANEAISWDRNRGLLPERRVPVARLLSTRRVEALLPGLPEPGLAGGAVWYDGQACNTERLSLAFLQGAREAGAAAANYAAVRELVVRGGRVAGVRLTDRLTGRDHAVEAALVVNAAGPWVDAVVGTLGRATQPLFGMSKGLNLVTRRVFGEFAAALPYQSGYTDSQAVLDKKKLHFFVVPWKQWSLIGTRHLPWQGDPDSFDATEEDIARFLDEVNRAYPPARLQRADVLRVYAGMLPALPSAAGADVQITKQYLIHDHAVADGLEGLLSVVGVKWTTACDVAAKTAAVALRKLGRAPRAVDDLVPLPAGRVAGIGEGLAALREIAGRRYGEALLERLFESHGAAAVDVLRLAERHRELADVLDGPSPTLAAEVVTAVRAEMAERLDDVIYRRTELGLLNDTPLPSLRRAAELMAAELGWDARRVQTELDAAHAIQAAPRVWRHSRVA